jgi:hypothetical protein
MRFPIRLFPLIFIFLSACGDKAPAPVSSDVPAPASIPDTALANRPQPAAESYAPVDLSPMDMSYFPVDYPKLKMAGAIQTPPLARVIYSRPHLEGRHIFREVLKYGEPWRLGANEATELQLFRPARVQDKSVAAGRYILYCIPQPDTWTIVLNSNADTWGLKPDSTRDVARFSVPVKRIAGRFEYYTMVFEKTPLGADLLMAWDDAEVRLPIRF